jgi:hypothetical protein
MINDQLVEEAFKTSVLAFFNISSVEECINFYRNHTNDDFDMEFDGDCVLNKDEIFNVMVKMWKSFPDVKFNVTHLGGI